MPQFVALLRGVNVGKAKRIPMAELRTLLTSLGYTNVATLLNSGNAVFHCAKGTSAKHAAAITAAISAHFKVVAPVVVKSSTELAAIVAENPVRAETADHSRLLVAFAHVNTALSNLAAIESLVVAPEKFNVGKSAAYLLCVPSVLESKAAVALLGKVGGNVTTRNWATVLKLQALANERVA